MSSHDAEDSQPANFGSQVGERGFNFPLKRDSLGIQSTSFASVCGEFSVTISRDLTRTLH